MTFLIFFFANPALCVPSRPKSSVIITLAKGISILSCVQFSVGCQFNYLAKHVKIQCEHNGQMLVRNSSILCLSCTVRKKKMTQSWKCCSIGIKSSFPNIREELFARKPAETERLCCSLGSRSSFINNRNALSLLDSKR